VETPSEADVSDIDSAVTQSREFAVSLLGEFPTVRDFIEAGGDRAEVY
jgi:hypothetical protein